MKTITSKPEFKEAASNTSIHFQRTRTKIKGDKSTRNIPFSLNQLEEEGVLEGDQFVFSKMRKLKHLFNACRR